MSRVDSHDSWFDFKEPKNGRTRIVEVGASTLQYLKTLRKAQNGMRFRLGVAWEDYGLIFTADDGTPRRPSAVSSAFRTLVIANALEGLRFHDLRHSHATIIAQIGCPAPCSVAEVGTLDGGIHPRSIRPRPAWAAACRGRSLRCRGRPSALAATSGDIRATFGRHLREQVRKNAPPPTCGFMVPPREFESLLPP